MATAASSRSVLVPQLDRRGVPVFSLFVAMICLGSILIITRNFTIAPALFSGLPLVIVWLLSAGILLRMGWERMATWLGAMAVAYGQVIPVYMVLGPAASFGFPTVDAYLSAADKALGFDWKATAFALHPYLRPLMFGYFSFGWQPLPIIALLAATNTTRCWQFVTAAGACSCVAAILFIFFPAYGAFAYYGVTPDQYPPFTYESTPWNWLPTFEKLRNGYGSLDISVGASLVSFPSYHASIGALCFWAVWPFRWLRVPSFALNALLIIGALVWGTHHLIDLIAGIALAVLAVVAVRKIIG